MIRDIEDFLPIFEAVPGSSALIKPDAPTYTILCVTDDFALNSGRTKAELINKGIFESFPDNPDVKDFSAKESLSASLQYVLDQKTAHELPVQRYDVENADGSFEERYWTAINKPVLNKAGEVKYIIHTAIEITDKIKAKKIKESLKLAEQSYNLFMQAPVAISILQGKDQVIALANDKILEIWRKDDSVIGKTVLDALPEIKGTVFPKLLDDVFTSGRPYYANESHAKFIRQGKEELVYFNFVYQPFYEDDGKIPVGVMVIATEVTGQVVARKKAEESEQRYRNFIAEASVATGVYEGPEMRIQSANDAMIKLWGKDASVIGKTLKEALPELQGQPFLVLLDKVYKTGETYFSKDDKGELIVDGVLQTFYFNFSYKALRNTEGEIYGILNMAIDVTDQVKAQKALKESELHLQRKVEERTTELQHKNNELEYSNEELQQYAYIASHDLQEPLRKIRMFSDMLSKQVEPEAATTKYVEKISASAERMSGLINSLLEYSRLSKAGIRYEKVDLNIVFQNVLSDYELLIAQKNALIKLDNLPAIQAVPLQINQLFYNLIGNALKFTKRNVQPIISVTTAKVDNAQKNEWGLESLKEYIAIDVKDNGIGFEQNYVDKIFTIFQRLTDRSQYVGYGIGLALCKKVIDTHKGRIFAEGKLKEGATFKVVLPVKQ